MYMYAMWFIVLLTVAHRLMTFFSISESGNSTYAQMGSNLEEDLSEITKETDCLYIPNFIIFVPRFYKWFTNKKRKEDKIL
jgi:hypothetical protein